MPDQTEKLLKMKSRMDEAERERDKTDGRLSVLDDKLKKEYGCNSLEESEREQEELENKIAEKDKKLSEITEKLEDDYEWD